MRNIRRSYNMQNRIEIHESTNYLDREPEVYFPKNLLFYRIYINMGHGDEDYLDVIPRNGYLEVRASQPLIVNMPSSNEINLRPRDPFGKTEVE